jgi:hypothetical protein
MAVQSHSALPSQKTCLRLCPHTFVGKGGRHGTDLSVAPVLAEQGLSFQHLWRGVHRTLPTRFSHPWCHCPGVVSSRSLRTSLFECNFPTLMPVGAGCRGIPGYPAEGLGAPPKAWVTPPRAWVWCSLGPPDARGPRMLTVPVERPLGTQVCIGVAGDGAARPTPELCLVDISVGMSEAGDERSVTRPQKISGVVHS